MVFSIFYLLHNIFSLIGDSKRVHFYRKEKTSYEIFGLIMKFKCLYHSLKRKRNVKTQVILVLFFRSVGTL